MLGEVKDFPNDFLYLKMEPNDGKVSKEASKLAVPEPEVAQSDEDEGSDFDGVGSESEGESRSTNDAEAGKKRRRASADASSSDDEESGSDDSLASDAFDTIDRTNIVEVAVPEGRRATRSAVRANLAASSPRIQKQPRKDGEDDGEAELSD